MPELVDAATIVGGPAIISVDLCTVQRGDVESATRCTSPPASKMLPIRSEH